MSQGCKVGAYRFYSSTISATSSYDIGYGKYAYGIDGTNYHLNSYTNYRNQTRLVEPGAEYGRWAYGGSPSFTKYGNVESFTYYTIATQNPPSGGSLAGGGNYEAGSTCNIIATPNQGFVVSTIDDSPISPTTTGNKTYSITVNGDKTVTASFAAYYNIAFDTNGGIGAPATISPCLASGTYQLPYTVPTREGYAFNGWAISQAAAESGQATYQPGDAYAITTVFQPGQTITLYAVWGQATLTYDANGGDTTPASAVGYGTITLASAISRTGRIFLGWKIGSSIYAAGQNYSLVADITAVAQWTEIAIRNTNVDIGTLSLYDITEGAKVADEIGGWIMYSGVVGHRYRVDCDLKTNLYTKLGVYENGSFVEPYVKTFDGSDITGEYQYEEKDFHTIDFTAFPAAGGSGIVVSPASPDKTESGADYYIEAQPITIRGVPAAGYSFDRVDWLSDTLPMGSTTPNEQGEATLNNLAFNVTAAMQFSLIDYELEASVDAASDSAVSSVAITVGGDTAETANYGDTATFTATVASGYSFAGWYNAEGVLVSSANPYATTVEEDISLIAKAKVAISLDLAYPSETAEAAQTCHISVDGETAASLPKEFEVVLGRSFEYEVVLGERTSGTNWAFDGWYGNPSDVATIKAFARFGTITPTAALTMTAVVAASATKKLSVCVVDIGASENTPVDAENVPGAITAYGGVVPQNDNGSGRILLGAGGNIETQPFEFLFDGTQYVDVIASNTLTIGSAEKVFFGYVKTFATTFDDGPLPPESEIISKSNEEIFLLAANTTIYAYYGQARVVRTTLGYANGANVTMGEIAIVGLDPTDDGQDIGIDTDGKGASSTQGKKLYLLAIAKNGYRFAGWYKNQSASGDPAWSSANAEITVMSERMVYAFFVQDPNAVYEWEGSTTPKSMEWRSKTYAANKPINFSACRIDAMGYYPSKMVDLTVEAFSSPDNGAKATGTVKLTNINSQNARRLPVCRKERYTQVVINANTEIDALYTGTSMEGIAI